MSYKYYNTFVFTCGICTETIMGVNLRSQEGKSMDYVKAIKK